MPLGELYSPKCACTFEQQKAQSLSGPGLGFYFLPAHGDGWIPLEIGNSAKIAIQLCPLLFRVVLFCPLVDLFALISYFSCQVRIPIANLQKRLLCNIYQNPISQTRGGNFSIP